MRPCVLIASHHGGWDVSLLGFHCLHMKPTSHLSHLSALPGAWVTVSHLHASTAFISPPSSILPCPPPTPPTQSHLRHGATWAPSSLQQPQCQGTQHGAQAAPRPRQCWV